MMRRCFGNEALLMADEITGFPWEKAYVMASLGMDCSGLNCSTPSSKYCAHYGVMADKNGILRSVFIPPEIRDKVFKETVNIHSGERIERFLFEKISNLYFRYDDPGQMIREILEYNEKIKVVVD